MTQDVLRRIMRDYFGYDIHFVQNVTDIDDKVRFSLLALLVFASLSSPHRSSFDLVKNTFSTSSSRPPPPSPHGSSRTPARPGPSSTARTSLNPSLPKSSVPMERRR